MLRFGFSLMSEAYRSRTENKLNAVHCTPIRNEVGPNLLIENVIRCLGYLPNLIENHNYVRQIIPQPFQGKVCHKSICFNSSQTV